MLRCCARLFEVKLLQDLLDSRQDRALQHPQIRLLPRIDIEQDQSGQHSPTKRSS